MQGGGLVNNIINHLPFELHLPGYNYCGPGTKLQQRLARGDKGINQLDEACKEHDIAYANHIDIGNRHKADLQLMNMAKQRVKAKDARTGEKIASWIVNKVMKTKLKSGAGLKKSKSGAKLKTFGSFVSRIRSRLKKCNLKNPKNIAKFAYLAAKKFYPKYQPIHVPRVIPLPKTGGVLPLIPIFAGLSALGSLAGGAAGIAKSVNDYKIAQQNLRESERHNKTMESLALGKGLYIKPYKKGNGVFTNCTKN